MAVIENLQKHVEQKLNIITPVYNPDRHLWNVCVNSVLSQIDPNWKWYIGFDGEKSFHRAQRAERWEELYNHPNVQTSISRKRKGVSATRNNLIQLAHSGWLGFLDADNWLHDEYVSIVRQAINQTPMEPVDGKQPRKLFMFGQTVRVQAKHHERTNLYALNWRVPEITHLMLLLQGNKIDLGQIVHNLETGDERPMFCEDLDRLVDWDYILQLLNKGYEQIPIEKFITFYDHKRRPNRINNTANYDRAHCMVLHRWQNAVAKFIEMKNQILPADQQIDIEQYFARLPYDRQGNKRRR